MPDAQMHAECHHKQAAKRIAGLGNGLDKHPSSSEENKLSSQVSFQASNHASGAGPIRLRRRAG